MRLLPYRSVPEDAVSWDSWWYEREGVRKPLPVKLPSWDYSSSERLGVVINVDGEAVLEATALESLTHINAVLTVDCPSLGRRFVHVTPLSGEVVDGHVELQVDIPPGEVAAKLELAAHLVVADDLPPRPRVASRAGERLGSSPRRVVHLEGESSRFPTEAVSFHEVGLENAPWTLTADFVSLDDSFMGSVRLLVNDAHPLGRAVLADQSEGMGVGQLKVDLLRLLVSATCSVVLDEEGDDSEYVEGSVGAVVSGMCELFLRRSLKEAAAVCLQEPLKFERLCYEVLSP